MGPLPSGMSACPSISMQSVYPLTAFYADVTCKSLQAVAAPQCPPMPCGTVETTSPAQNPWLRGITTFGPAYPDYHLLAFQPLELLCEKAIGTCNRPLGAGEALRRVMECLASGILLPGKDGSWRSAAMMLFQLGWYPRCLCQPLHSESHESEKQSLHKHNP